MSLRDITKDIKKELNLNYTNKEIEIEEDVEAEDLYTPKNFTDRIHLNLNLTFNKIKEMESTPKLNTIITTNTETKPTDENIKITAREKNYLSTKDTKETYSPLNDREIPNFFISIIPEKKISPTNKNIVLTPINSFGNKNGGFGSLHKPGFSNGINTPAGSNSQISNLTTPNNNITNTNASKFNIKSENSFNFDAFSKNTNMIFKKKLPEKNTKNEYFTGRVNTGGNVGNVGNAVNSSAKNKSIDKLLEIPSTIKINNSPINNKNEAISQTQKHGIVLDNKTSKNDKIAKLEKTEKLTDIVAEKCEKLSDKVVEKKKIDVQAALKNNKSNSSSILNQFILNLVNNKDHKDKNETNFKNVKISNHININNLFVNPCPQYQATHAVVNNVKTDSVERKTVQTQLPKHNSISKINTISIPKKTQQIKQFSMGNFSRNSSKNSKTLELEFSLNHNNRKDSVTSRKISPKLSDIKEKKSPMLEKINSLKKTLTKNNKIPISNNLIKPKTIKQKLIKTNYFSELNYSFVKNTETLNDSNSKIKTNQNTSNVSFSKSNINNNNNSSKINLNLPNTSKIDCSNSFTKNTPLTERLHENIISETKKANKIVTNNKNVTNNPLDLNSLNMHSTNAHSSAQAVLKSNTLKRVSSVKYGTPTDSKENKNLSNNKNNELSSNFSIKRKMIDQLTNNYFTKNCKSNKKEDGKKQVVSKKINIAAGDADDSIHDEDF